MSFKKTSRVQCNRIYNTESCNSDSCDNETQNHRKDNVIPYAELFNTLERVLHDQETYSLQ